MEEISPLPEHKDSKYILALIQILHNQRIDFIIFDFGGDL